MLLLGSLIVSCCTEEAKLQMYFVSFSSISKEDLPRHLYFVHLQTGFAFLTLFSWAQREMCTHLLFAPCLVFLFAPGCVFSL